MSFGGSVLRQHVVEFIADATIGGVYTDGVRNSTSLTGPWTFVVPPGVAEIIIDAVSAGGGGGGGYNTGTSLSGGGGGCSGICMTDYKAKAPPLTNIIVTIGAVGAGGAAGFSGSRGGSTSVVGFLKGFYPHYTLSDFTLLGGGPGNVGGSGAGGNGGTLGNCVSSTGGSNSASPVGGASENHVSELNNGFSQGNTGRFFVRRGGGGGGANTTVTSAGANGGGIGGGGDMFNILYGPAGASEGFTGGAGNTNGTTISYGGGGYGGRSIFGIAGAPGAGAAAATNSTGYGAGGSGGGGGAAGGNGGPGYVRFTYWSVD